jgi:aminopeptidase
MKDPRIEKLADLLVNYSVAVRPGDKVVIHGQTTGEPLMQAVFGSVLRAGGNPILLPTLPGTEEMIYRYGNNEQLQHVPEPQRLVMSTYDARIYILSEQNTRELSNVDPDKMALRSRSRTELMKIMMQRSASGELRWVLGPYPTNSLAQDAEMSLSDYEDFVYGACLPDMNDPIGYWRRFSAWQQKIVEWLKGKERIRVVGKDTDLTMNIAGRTFISCDGRVNMPDGEVFTGPVENSMQGHVFFSYPAIEHGHEVSGVRLTFEHGQVVEAKAEKNQDYLLKTIGTDEGARRVGEFAIGTNEGITKFTREILFDEKIGGTFHMALGAAYPETGSKNESAIHWDMVCDLRDGGEIWVDDILLHKNGKFVIKF